MPEKTDTHPDADSFLIEGYRRMTPTLKFQLALEMSQSVMELSQIGIIKRHPGIGPLELRKRLGALLLGRDLSIKINQWDPKKEGY